MSYHKTNILIGSTAYRAFRAHSKQVVDDAQLALTYGFPNRPAGANGSLQSLESISIPVLLLALQCSSATACALPEGPVGARSLFPHAHGILHVYGYADRLSLATLECLNDFLPRVLSLICKEPVKFHLRGYSSPEAWFPYITKGYAHTEHLPELKPTRHRLHDSSCIAPVGKYRSPAYLTRDDLVTLAASAYERSDYVLFQKLFKRYALERAQMKALRPRKPRKPRVKPAAPVGNGRSLDQITEQHMLSPSVVTEMVNTTVAAFKAPRARVRKRVERVLVRMHTKHAKARPVDRDLRKFLKDRSYWKKKQLQGSIDSYVKWHCPVVPETMTKEEFLE